MNETIKSVAYDQVDILRAIRDLHLGGHNYECDITYGKGGFWKLLKRPEICMDVEPQFPFVVEADSSRLPLDSDSLHNIVFDPPFLTYIKNGRGHKDGKVALAARFGGYYTYSELEEHYCATIHQCARVLKKNGVLVVKTQDIVHNHKLHLTHCMVIEYMRCAGFEIKDLFILAATHRMPGPQKVQQRHARIHHSYFIVGRKK